MLGKAIIDKRNVTKQYRAGFAAGTHTVKVLVEVTLVGWLKLDGMLNNYREK